MKRTALLAVLLARAAALGSRPACAFSGFPFNGGFEIVDHSQPLGWDLTGTWLMGSVGACEGTKYVYLADTVAQAGDQMLSSGYRLVKPGDSLVLSASYQSPAGGAIVGLMLCDSLGRELFPMAAEPLPAATCWTPVQRRFVLAPDKCPRNLGSVRVLLSVSAAGQGASFDAVSLCTEGAVPCACGLCPAPMNALERPNLLPDPTLAATATGAQPGWDAVVIPGSPAGSQPIWLSAPVAVDLALPYEITSQVPGGAGADAFRLMARIGDPADPDSIWLQTPGASGGAAGAPAVHLDRLARQSAIGLVQIAVVPIPGKTLPDSLLVALEPEPVTLSVHGVAMAVEFDHPKDVTLFVSAVNNTGSTLAPTAHLKVVDAQGQQVSYEPRPGIQLSPHSAAYFPVKPTLPAAGEYTLIVHLLDHGRDLGQTSFSFKVDND